MRKLVCLAVLAFLTGSLTGASPRAAVKAVVGITPASGKVPTGDVYGTFDYSGCDPSGEWFHIEVFDVTNGVKSVGENWVFSVPANKNGSGSDSYVVEDVIQNGRTYIVEASYDGQPNGTAITTVEGFAPPAQFVRADVPPLPVLPGIPNLPPADPQAFLVKPSSVARAPAPGDLVVEWMYIGLASAPGADLCYVVLMEWDGTAWNDVYYDDWYQSGAGPNNSASGTYTIPNATVNGKKYVIQVAVTRNGVVSFEERVLDYTGP